MAKLDFLNLKKFDDKLVRGPAAPEKTTRRTSRQQRKRQTANDEYRATSDIYKEQNPTCAYCGGAHEQTDHIVSGTGRGLSLLNPDTWNPSCANCNCNKKISLAQKAAAKVVHVLRTIERLRGRNFKDEENELILEAIKNREPGHVR